MEVQNALGADIIMAFDECPPADAPPEYHRDGGGADAALGRGSAWPPTRRPGDQSLFGIVQGGTDPALREQCAAELIAMDFPGYAIGGLAVGEGFEAMKGVLADTTPLLPADKPRYLMGVGFPRDIVAAVASGGGHVRLRPADPQRPQRLRLYRRRADAAAKQPIHPRHRADRGRLRLLRLPHISPAGRSGTFFSPARCLARCWFPCIIFGSTNG